jgi:uncharacterized protein (DUF1800 family)
MLAGLAAVLIVAGGSSRVLTSDAFDRPLAPELHSAHVLNRLAYGPSAADVDALRQMGVEAWIRAQLDPRRLPERPALDAKLNALPSLTLSTREIVDAYRPAPPRAVSVRATDAGVFVTQRGVPPDLEARITRAPVAERREIINGLSPDLRRRVLIALPLAVFADLPEQVEALKARSENANNPMAAPEAQTPLVTAEQFRVLQGGTDEEKTAILRALTPDDRMLLFHAVPPQSIPAVYRRQALATVQPPQVVLAELVDSKLYRALYSTRQLEEVLVDFWLNHFSVFSGKGAVRQMVTSYERDAIRPHVFGPFRELLLATARHPAMLFYLDNWMSQATPDGRTPSAPKPGSPPQGLNENYARELMELHTLGVDGGYTQADVIGVARAFTGWTILEPNRRGEFRFDPGMHDRQEKIVLGRTIPRDGGESDGVAVIDALARHPSTAMFVSKKLAQRFVADDPPAALVERMARTFLDTGGDLRALYETLLLSREMMSEGAWQSKLKSPLEVVVSSLRALDAEVTDTTAIAQWIADLGQPLYEKLEPTGYPNVSDQWVSTASLLGRLNFAAALSAGRVAGVEIDPPPFDAADAAGAATRLLGFAPPAATVSAIERGMTGQQLSAEAFAAVVLASPEFQRR